MRIANVGSRPRCSFLGLPLLVKPPAEVSIVLVQDGIRSSLVSPQADCLPIITDRQLVPKWDTPSAVGLNIESGTTKEVRSPRKKVTVRVSLSTVPAMIRSARSGDFSTLPSSFHGNSIFIILFLGNRAVGALRRACPSRESDFDSVGCLTIQPKRFFRSEPPASRADGYIIVSMKKIVSEKRLRRYAENTPTPSPLLGSMRSLIVWAADWKNAADLEQGFNNVDPVIVKRAAIRFYVFNNIQGNNHRMIAAIHFNTGVVFVLRLMTHEENMTSKNG